MCGFKGARGRDHVTFIFYLKNNGDLYAFFLAVKVSATSAQALPVPEFVSSSVDILLVQIKEFNIHLHV